MVAVFPYPQQEVVALQLAPQLILSFGGIATTLALKATQTI